MKESFDQRPYILAVTVIIVVAMCVVPIGFWSIIPPTFVQVANLVISSSILLFAAAVTWGSSLDAHFLRWPYALWLAGICLMMGAVWATRHSENALVGWLLASPFFAIATYSFRQTRMPDGGKQLDLPVNLVHGFKRLEWRWFTSPKLDFWPCWIGLLFPATLGAALFVYDWNEPLNGWLLVLKIGGGLSFAWFVLRWFTAPKDRRKHWQLTLAVGWFRCLAIIYSFSIGLTISDLSWDRISGKVYAVALCIFSTGFFEKAYRRCIERQSPSGIGEYEALEGPSLGL